MKYDLEQVHKHKGHGRRIGATVDAVMAAIGCIMVTENEIIPFVVSEMSRASNIENIFISVCTDHFDEKPVKHGNYDLGIEGYTSRIRIMSHNRDRMSGTNKLDGYSIQPIIDLD